jgi:hypothetical protein
VKPYLICRNPRWARKKVVRRSDGTTIGIVCEHMTDGIRYWYDLDPSQPDGFCPDANGRQTSLEEAADELWEAAEEAAPEISHPA